MLDNAWLCLYSLLPSSDGPLRIAISIPPVGTYAPPSCAPMEVGIFHETTAGFEILSQCSASLHQVAFTSPVELEIVIRLQIPDPLCFTVN